MQYPYRNADEEGHLERLASTPYALDDAPYLKTERYSLDSSYSQADVDAKRLLDMQGAQDNLWWYNRNREEITSL